jgi:hypothetical protein
MHESKFAYIQGRPEVHARAPRNQPKTVIEALEGLTVEQHVSQKKAVDQIRKLRSRVAQHRIAYDGGRVSLTVASEGEHRVWGGITAAL